MLDVICSTCDSEFRVQGNRGPFSLSALPEVSRLRARSPKETAATACRDGIARPGITSWEPTRGVARRQEGTARNSNQRSMEDLLRLAGWSLLRCGNR